MFTGRTTLLESLRYSYKYLITLPFKQVSTRTERFFQLIIIVLIVWLITFSSSCSMKSSQRRGTDAFVVTLAGADHRLPKVTKLFQTYARIELIPFYGFNGNTEFRPGQKKKRSRLTPGQRGLRETMKLFFRMVLETNYDEVLVFQDDAIPHLNFTSLYRNLHPRCLHADVLLLGASIWHRNRTAWPNGICFDADNQTFGAYGLSVKRKAFQPILNWINTVRDITFDHMYADLQTDGLTVRVAHPPFLVIMDVSHKSLIHNHRSSLQFDVNERAKLHDWHLKEYPASVFESTEN